MVINFRLNTNIYHHHGTEKSYIYVIRRKENGVQDLWKYTLRPLMQFTGIEYLIN